MNNKTCAMCGASIDANAQVCPTCGFQQSQQPQGYQLGVQQPVQSNQQMSQQPMMNQQMPQQPMMNQQMPQQQMMNQQMPQQSMQQNQQAMMYDPNTGQPLQKPVQPFSQPQPQNNVIAEDKPTNLYIGLGLILLGWFIAGIICGAAALSLGLSYKGKSPLRYVVIALGGIEVLIVLVSLVANFF